jgi:hypothetical protein
MLVLSLPSHAQSTLPEIPRKETQLGILNALNEDRPKLGMNILSVESGYHVLMSTNGRYLVKGTLWDLWDGVFEPYVVEGEITALPAKISPESFFVQLGNPDGEAMHVYLKYGCHSCREVALSLLNDDVLKTFNIKIMVVHNDALSKSVAQHIYCQSDNGNAFETIFSNMNVSGESLVNCNSFLAKKTPLAAMAQKIKALPFTYFPTRKYGVVGESSAYF